MPSPRKSIVRQFTYQTKSGKLVMVPAYERRQRQDLGAPERLKTSWIKRYRDGESCPEIANGSGYSVSTVWVSIKGAGVIRSRGEAMALRNAKHPAIASGRGVQGVFHSKKNGRWLPTSSRYEFVRMSQLEGDQEVVSFSRSTDRIRYMDGASERFYSPDLEVIYRDGAVVVEEIKPARFVSDTVVQAKAAAACIFYAHSGKVYKIVTDDDIGLDFIRNFDWPGLSQIAEAEHQKARKEKDRERQRLSKRKELQEMSLAARAERNMRLRAYHAARKKKMTREQLEAHRRKNAAAVRAYKKRKAADHASQNALL